MTSNHTTKRELTDIRKYLKKAFTKVTLSSFSSLVAVWLFQHIRIPVHLQIFMHSSAQHIRHRDPSKLGGKHHKFIFSSSLLTWFGVKKTPGFSKATDFFCVGTPRLRNLSAISKTLKLKSNWTNYKSWNIKCILNRFLLGHTKIERTEAHADLPNLSPSIINKLILRN